MPGRVVRVLVKVGERVERGAPVLALPWRWQGFTGFGDLEQVLAGLERPDLSAR